MNSIPKTSQVEPSSTGTIDGLFCPLGWRQYKLDCYSSLAEAVTVEKCQSLCNDNLSYLPCIQNEDQNAYLARMVYAELKSSSIWIERITMAGDSEPGFTGENACTSSFTGASDAIYHSGNLTLNFNGRWLPGQNLQQCVCHKEATVSDDSNAVLFSYTGTAQEYVIPEGLSALQITLYGASGGSSRESASAGGKGLKAVSTIATPVAGSVIHIFVGGQGLTGVTSGGFNGGGDSTNAHSGSGGGATDVRYPTTALVDRFLVAGGGGGAEGLIGSERGGEAGRGGGFFNGGASCAMEGEGEGVGSSWLLYGTRCMFADDGNSGHGYAIVREIDHTTTVEQVTEVQETDTILMDMAPNLHSIEPAEFLTAFSFDWISSVPEYPTPFPTAFPSPPKSAPPSLTPTTVPSILPTATPSVIPSQDPSVNPSVNPSVHPSVNPSVQPSIDPSVNPSVHPSVHPSVDPSVLPSFNLSFNPSFDPSVYPSVHPSVDPSVLPSIDPSVYPSVHPSGHPSVNPSVQPSFDPSVYPSVHPSVHPSVDPSVQPSVDPSVNPSVNPTVHPSVDPSVQPSIDPSVNPSAHPTVHPSLAPSMQPSCMPTNIPYSLAWMHNSSIQPKYVVSFDDHGEIWSGIRRNGTIVELRGESAAGTITAQFQDLLWLSVVSVLRRVSDGQLIFSGKRNVNGVATNSIAHCNAQTASLGCAVKSYPDLDFIAASLISFTGQTVLFGRTFGQVTGTIFSSSFSERSFTIDSIFMKTFQITLSASPPKLAGSFVSGSAESKSGEIFLIVGYFRAADGSLQPTYLQPINENIINSAELITKMACDPISADLFIGGGIALSTENVGVSAYILRANALFRTFLYGVRYVSLADERRVLSGAASGVSYDVVQGVQLVDQTLYILINSNVTSLTKRITYMTIMKANATTGDIVKQVSIAVHNASTSCSNMGLIDDAVVLICSLWTQSPETTSDVSKRTVLLSADTDLTLFKLPVEFYIHGDDVFHADNFPFKATYFPATSQPVVFRTTEHTNGGTSAPVRAPTIRPSLPPSTRPSIQPTGVPSTEPSSSPTATPSISPQPTSQPSTNGPTNTYKPTVKPTQRPSTMPSAVPTKAPTTRPTLQPTTLPSMHPTLLPSPLPTVTFTSKPTYASSIKATRSPSASLSWKPTILQSIAPSLAATFPPTSREQTAAGQTLAGSIVAYVFGSLAFIWVMNWLYQFFKRTMERRKKRKEMELAFASIRQSMRHEPPRRVHLPTRKQKGVTIPNVLAVGAYANGTGIGANIDGDVGAEGMFIRSETPPSAVTPCIAISPYILSESSSDDIYSISSFDSSEWNDTPSGKQIRSRENEVEEGGVN